MVKNVTVSISDDLSLKMDELKDVNWSEVCRSAISEYIKKRNPIKGSEILDLEKFIRHQRDELNFKDRKDLCKSEISRFTSKWGEPDVIEYDDRPGINKTYVILRKKIEVNLGKDTKYLLNIRNDESPPTYNDFFFPKEYGKSIEYRSQKWKDKSDGNMDMIVEYFTKNGYKIREVKDLWGGIIDDYLYGANVGEDKCLSQPPFESILLAMDKYDVIFLAHK